MWTTCGACLQTDEASSSLSGPLASLQVRGSMRVSIHVGLAFCATEFGTAQQFLPGGLRVAPGVTVLSLVNKITQWWMIL
jgi:hypothetical protein